MLDGVADHFPQADAIRNFRFARQTPESTLEPVFSGSLLVVWGRATVIRYQKIRLLPCQGWHDFHRSRKRVDGRDVHPNPSGPSTGIFPSRPRVHLVPGFTCSILLTGYEIVMGNLPKDCCQGWARGLYHLP
jgi:hypothetical protein